jgi:hypothetical protein
MQTIADKYPDAMKSFRAQGYVSLAKMCGHFVRGSDMARALGMFPSSSGISKWMTGRNMPKWSSEQAAKEWLQAQKVEQRQFDYAMPGPLELARDVPPAVAAPASDTLMVVTPKGKHDKVLRVLQMMGCEVVEV